MALLGGYHYKSRTFAQGTWMEYLPNNYCDTYCISKINCTQCNIACNNCPMVHEILFMKLQQMILEMFERMVFEK